MVLLHAYRGRPWDGARTARRCISALRIIEVFRAVRRTSGESCLCIWEGCLDVVCILPLYFILVCNIRARWRQFVS